MKLAAKSAFASVPTTSATLGASFWALCMCVCYGYGYGWDLFYIQGICMYVMSLVKLAANSAFASVPTTLATLGASFCALCKCVCVCML